MVGIDGDIQIGADGTPIGGTPKKVKRDEFVNCVHTENGGSASGAGGDEVTFSSSDASAQGKRVVKHEEKPAAAKEEYKVEVKAQVEAKVAEKHAFVVKKHSHTESSSKSVSKQALSGTHQYARSKNMQKKNLFVKNADIEHKRTYFNVKPSHKAQKQSTDSTVSLQGQQPAVEKSKVELKKLNTGASSADVKISDTHLEGEYTNSSASFNTNMSAFKDLNIKEGTSQSEPLRVVNGVKILSTEPGMTADEIKVNHGAVYDEVQLKNGAVIQLNRGEQGKDAKIIYNGGKVVLVGLKNSNYKGKGGNEQVAVVNCSNIRCSGKDSGRYVKTKDDFVFVNSTGTVESSGRDNIAALNGSKITFAPTSTQNKRSETIPTNIAADESSQIVRSSSSEMQSAWVYNTKMSVKDVLKNINEGAAASPSVVNSQRGAVKLSGDYKFTYGDMDASMTSKENGVQQKNVKITQGAFNTTVDAFKSLNIEKGTSQSNPVATVNGVKFLSANGVSPDKIKVKDIPAYFEVTLPDGNQVYVSKNRQPQNAEIVFGENQKIAMCNVVDSNVKFAQNGGQIAVVSCKQCSVSPTDKSGASGNVDVLVANSEKIEVAHSMASNIVSVGGSSVVLNGFFGGNGKKVQPASVATDALSTFTVDHDAVSGGTNLFQTGYSINEIVDKINKRYQ